MKDFNRFVTFITTVMAILPVIALVVQLAIILDVLH